MSLINKYIYIVFVETSQKRAMYRTDGVLYAEYRKRIYYFYRNALSAKAEAKRNFH